MATEILAGRVAGVKRKGAGAQAVLIHCSLAHSGAWAGVMHGLSDQFAMTAIDLPGHGQTEFEAGVDIQVQTCEAVIALMEAASGPVHLIGHSFGATIALRCAVDRPDLVASLTLFEPVYICLLAEGKPSAYVAETEASRGFWEHAQAANWPEAANAFLKRWGGSVELEDMPPEQAAYMLKTIPLILENYHSMIEVHPENLKLAEVADVNIPCLLMEGDLSPVSTRQINDLLELHMPQTTRQVVNGAGHMGPITHPDVMVRAIKGFIPR